MASILFGSIVTGMKGTLNSHIFQQNGSNYIVRGKNRKSFNLKSDFHLEQKHVQNIAASWRDLSPTIQLMWQGATTSFPSQTPFKEKRTPSAYALYMKCTLNCINAGVTPPGQPGTPDTFAIAGLISAIAASHSPSITFTLANSVPTGQVLQVLSSPCYSVGRVNPPAGWRIITNIPAAGVGSHNITADWGYSWGNPISGANLALKFRIFSALSQTYSQADMWTTTVT